MDTGLLNLINNTGVDGRFLLPSAEEPPVPEIGSTVVISQNNQVECTTDSPSKIWSGKRVLCSFSSNNIDLDEYPFHAVTYGEPGELRGLSYNDHNYAKLNEDETSNDNQLALLAKLALAKHDSQAVIELPQSDSCKATESVSPTVVKSTEQNIGTAQRGGNIPHMTIIKAPFVNQNATQAQVPLQPSISGSTCKVATSNGRTILLTPSRGSLGASVQIHRVAPVNSPQVVLRTDYSSSSEAAFINSIPGSLNNPIRCICGFTRDDGCLVQCSNCKVLQHAECMAPSSNSVLPKPYFCELCQPRPVMVSEAVGLQRRKMSTPTSSQPLPAKTIRLANPTTFRLPRSHGPTTHNSTITPNRLFLAGNGSTQATTALSVRPIQVRLGEVVGSTVYQVDPTTLNQFSPRFINLDPAVARPHSTYVTTAVGNQRASKRKQDLFTLAGEPAPSFDMTSSYAYDEKNATTNGQHSTSATSDHASAVPSTEGNDLPGPKFYRTPSQAVVSVGGLDSVEGGKPHSTANIAAFGEAAPEVASAATTLSSGVPEPASPDVVIWSDSYEKALETRLSDSLKQRIRNIFLTPSERELRTLQMSDSSALSRGQQRCRVTTLDLGRKGLVATESIDPNQPIVEYKGYAMLMDEYSQQHDYRKHYNPFVLFYKQLDKAVICLDASNYGNEARFIRRSCMPNCEVRLTFPPTDSFSSVVNPQCIQFVVTSMVNRVLPAGTELTVAFDFDYTACSYPVRCACGRGAPFCPVSDWSRRHKPQRSSDHLSDIEEGEAVGSHSITSTHRDNGDADDFDDDDEDEPDDNYGRPLISRRGHGSSFMEKNARNRLALRRLLAPKRVSPAFSRVPYPSAKHMVQEQQHRRHQNGLPSSMRDPLSSTSTTIGKRGGRGLGRGTRGGGVRSGRGGLSGAANNTLLRRPSRPRGRPPNSGIKRQLQRPLPHVTPPSPSLPHAYSRRGTGDIDDDEGDERFYSPPPSDEDFSSSPRTDDTDPGGASPWFRSARSPLPMPRSQARRGKKLIRKGADQQHSRHYQRHRLLSDEVDQQQQQLLDSPQNLGRIRRRSSLDTSQTGFGSPLRDNEDIEELSPLAEDEDNYTDGPTSPPIVTPKKRARKLSGRLKNEFDQFPGKFSERNGPNSAKRARRQSDAEALPPSEQGDGLEPEASPVRASKSREDNWLAEVLRRIERMEKKRQKSGTRSKKLKRERSGGAMESASPSRGEENTEHFEPEEGLDPSSKKDHEVLPAVHPPPSKKQRRRSTPSGAHSEVPPPVTPLSREDRWMQMQLQRIAEMESSDAPGDHSHNGAAASATTATSVRQRRRANSSAKATAASSIASHDSPKKDPTASAAAAGEEECSLIVYKRREQDPMAKFSRSRTGHQHHPVTRTFSLVENFVEEDLPAGGELLDDHASSLMGVIPSTVPDSVFSGAAPPSPPKPSKKRWLSQALMEEDQQRQGCTGRTLPSPDSSVTPPPLPDQPNNNNQNPPNSRAVNPKKRIISQIEEALAQRRNSVDIINGATTPPSPSDLPSTPSSKLPPKKRQAEDDSSNSNDVFAQTPSLAEPCAMPVSNEKAPAPTMSESKKQEKVRMSLSEYRRRRGLSTASVESSTTTAAKAPVSTPAPVTPLSAPPIPPSTPPGSPVVDLKRLLPSLPVSPPVPQKGTGPRTPSEPPSDEEDTARLMPSVVAAPPSPLQLTADLLPNRSQGAVQPQLPPPSAPASLPSPRKEAIERLIQKSYSFDAGEKQHISPPHPIHRQYPHHPPLGGYDRHLSGHAHRRASPPPPPPAVNTASPPSPSLPPSEYVLRRDREIQQWQMERQHHQFSSQNHHNQQQQGYHQASNHLESHSSSHNQRRRPSIATASNSTASSSTTTRRTRGGAETVSSSPPRPPLQRNPRSHHQPSNHQRSQSTAFTHRNMESIQETLRLRQEHLRAQLRDLQKATAGGSG